MSSVDELRSRLDAAFRNNEQKRVAFQSKQLEEHQEREQRLEQFEQLLSALKDVWRPRLETLSQCFGSEATVTPTILPGHRDVLFQFHSELARIELRFTACTDSDVRRLVVSSHLEILPILMKYDSHAEIEFPLESVDKDRLGSWVDDRILAFVDTYFSLHENASYLKGHLVIDPIAKIQFPKYAAGATLERGKETIYFIGEETRQQYLKLHGG